MPHLRDCVVLHGPELTPHHCADFAWDGDHITGMDLGAPCPRLDTGTLVVMPGLYNGHTHLGDSALPDGATGLTLEQGFFRPHGYKYVELAQLDHDEHLARVEAALRYMVRTGTIAHLDFREQGAAGAALLREAATRVGIDSIILSQFNDSPFDDAELTDAARPLPSRARAELDAMLAVADGFSESTMNDLTDAAWREVRTRTDAAGKLRAIHCLENEGYRELSLRRTGHGDLIRAFELLDPHLIVHLTSANAEEIALMAGSGRTAALNPRANTTLGLPVPPILDLLDAGTNLLLGTDNVMLTQPDLFAELDFTYRLTRSQATAARAAEPHPAAILKMVTSNIRPLLGGDHYGYLEKGLPASFVVLDFTAGHLRHTRNLLATVATRIGTADVLATYRSGRRLWAAPAFESADL